MLLDFIEINDNHSDKNIAEHVNHCLKFYDLMHKLTFIAGDNASNKKTTADELFQIIIRELSKDQNINFNGCDSFIECLTHQLNLIIQDLLSDLNFTCIKKVKIIANTLHTSLQSKQQWKMICESCKNMRNKFIEQPVKT